MLCNYPSFSSHTSISILKYKGLQWQFTRIQTLSLTQTSIQGELSHTQAWRILSPTREEDSRILEFFLYTAMQELIGYRWGNKY